MGVTSSRIEDDKALLLCQGRRDFVRQLLDGRRALAAAHLSYVQSLKNTGVAIRKFVEPEAPVESSLCTSISATPEPLALTKKSASQFSNSSPSLSQHVEEVESVSLLPSSPYSGRFQVNYLKSKGNVSKTVEQRPPLSVTATLRTSSDVSPKAVSDEASTIEDASLSSGQQAWDYFGFFHPIDDQFSLHDGWTLNHGFESADDVRRLREEEIPELEGEEEKAYLHGKSEFSESEDEFGQASSEPLVRIFKNRNHVIDSRLTNRSSAPFEETMPPGTEKINEKKTTLQDGMCETGGSPDMMPVTATKSMAMPLVKGKTEAEKEHGSERRAEADKKHGPENKLAAKDLFSSVKEIEFLFLKASESGRDVPRMLEANKVNFRPLFSEGKASRSKESTFLTAIFVCCKEEVCVAQESATNEIKYITWHGSVSSHSSSSRNHVGGTSKDDIEDTSSSLFSCLCMDSGSHASTLDRLYTWERKLYDEVRASSIIRRDYDMKCKLLRHQDSKGEESYRVDKTRAAVRELHSRIRVAIQRINYISKIIEDLRDKELQPQLQELIGGLSRMWGMMLECHKLQCDIISVAYNNGNSKVSMWSEYHREVAILLEYELKGLNSSFNEWMTAHKSYLQAINGWLLKCVFPVKQSHKPRKRSIEFSPHRDIAPPIYVICKDWLVGLEELPAKDMEDAMKKLAAEVNNSLPRQEKKNRKTGRRGELPEDVKRNEDLVDCSLCLDTLKKDLKSFLNQLKTFAEASTKMYGDLGIAIDKARCKYENLGWMQIPLMA